MARLIRGIKPDLQVLGQTDRTKRNAKVVAIFSQELDSILENISISDIKGACINPASIFADHLVRFGSHYDLKGGYANLSE
ncbi:MAG: hypothetical protein NT001_05995, partial [Candidatus Woesearchaeota archaeon]|nr:hypothetical protein [Candidatus Woesearchaeota archaeon]